MRADRDATQGGTEPRRILVCVPNWVGDAVMATPALRALRDRFPKAHIVHLLRPYLADLLRGTGFCDAEVFWPARPIAATPAPAGGSPSGSNEGRPPSGASPPRVATRSFAQLVRRLRRERFDLAVLLTNSFRSALVARLAGARRRVGYARDGRGWLLTDRLAPERAEGKFVPVPALAYYNALARHVGCGAINERLALATSAADEAAIDSRLGTTDPARPLVVLNPGANYGSAKCWPAENYAALADALFTRYGARVVASLGPGEGRIAARLRNAARHALDVFSDPPLGLGPLRALVRRSDLLITNDTGPRHFAAAFDRPVVTIYGSSDPAWTVTRHPKERSVMLDLECRPCMQRTCPLKHHDCMRKLEPERVVQAADEFLEPWRRSAGGRGVRLESEPLKKPCG